MNNATQSLYSTMIILIFSELKYCMGVASNIKFWVVVIADLGTCTRHALPCIMEMLYTLQENQEERVKHFSHPDYSTSLVILVSTYYVPTLKHLHKCYNNIIYHNIHILSYATIFFLDCRSHDTYIYIHAHEHFVSFLAQEQSRRHTNTKTQTHKNKHPMLSKKQLQDWMKTGSP